LGCKVGSGKRVVIWLYLDQTLLLWFTLPTSALRLHLSAGSQLIPGINQVFLGFKSRWCVTHHDGVATEAKHKMSLPDRASSAENRFIQNWILIILFFHSLDIGKIRIWHHGTGYFDCHCRVPCHHRDYRGSASGSKTKRSRKAPWIENESCRGMFARDKSWP
jgi:hypothetical protein